MEHLFGNRKIRFFNGKMSFEKQPSYSKDKWFAIINMIGLLILAIVGISTPIIEGTKIYSILRLVIWFVYITFGLIWIITTMYRRKAIDWLQVFACIIVVALGFLIYY